MSPPRNRRYDATDFWVKVEKGPDCWNWTGTASKRGTPLTTYHGVRERVHRISYRIAFPDQCAALDAGQRVWHKCGNVRCVNPDHLYMARVPVEDAATIRDEFYSGRATQTEIAKRYGVQRTFITKLINGVLPRYRTDGVA